MHRIDHVTRAVNANGAGKDGFTGGNPLTQVAATTVTPDWLNAVQEELANAVGLVSPQLLKGQNNQLASALVIQLDAISLGTMYTRGAGFYTGIAAVANDDDGMVIVGVGGNDDQLDPVLVSRDGGKTFTSPTGVAYAAPLNRLTAVTYGNGRFVAVGNAGDIRTSPEGTTWTKRTPGAPLFSGTFNVVHYAAAQGVFIAGGADGVIQTSPDGVTWTRRYLPGGATDAINRITSDAERVLLIAGTKIFASTDGLTWFATTLDIAPTEPLGAISPVPSGGYLAVSGAGGTDLTTEGRYGWRSTDGLTWVRQNLTIGAMYPFVRIVARTGAIIGVRSPDGALAIAMPSGTNYAPRVAVVAGTGSYLTASTLWRTNRRWFGRVGDTFYTSAITLY